MLASVQTIERELNYQGLEAVCERKEIVSCTD